MSLARFRWLLLLAIASSALAACGRELPGSPPSTRPASPVEEIWFRDAFRFLGDLHQRLADPGLRQEFGAHLRAGDPQWALQRIGVDDATLHAFFARLDLERPALESRWPELTVRSQGEGGGFTVSDLEEFLAREDWPPLPGAESKMPEYMCAAYEFYENLSQCVSWSPWIRALCYYQAYLLYLQHLTHGCD